MTYELLTRRGVKADLPIVAPLGELLATTDTHELFIGTGDAVVQIGGLTGATGPAGADGHDGADGADGAPGPTVPVLESDVTGLVADLALKAPLASPGLTGSPTAPTKSALDNSTKIATTAYADAAVGVEKTRALAAEALVEVLTNKNVASGYAGLDGTGKVPAAEIPYLHFFQGVPLPNQKIIPQNRYVTSSGAVALYTVPAGKKAIFIAGLLLNSSGGTLANTSVAWALLAEGIQVILSTNASIVNTIQAAFGAEIPFVAQAGDVLTLNVAGQPVLMTGHVVEFDAAGPLFTSRVNGSAGGDITVFTCPAGKVAFLGAASAWFPTGINGLGALFAWNSSGSTKTVAVYLIPSGSVKDATTLLKNGASLGSVALSAFSNFGITLPVCVSAGDVILVNVSASGAIWFFTTGLLY